MHVFGGKKTEFPFFEIPIIRYCLRVHVITFLHGNNLSFAKYFGLLVGLVRDFEAD